MFRVSKSKKGSKKVQEKDEVTEEVLRARRKRKLDYDRDYSKRQV